MKKKKIKKEKEKSSYVRCIDAAEGYRARLPGTSIYRKDTQRLNSGVVCPQGHMYYGAAPALQPWLWYHKPADAASRNYIHALIAKLSNVCLGTGDT